jgi:hypothetical protein
MGKIFCVSMLLLTLGGCAQLSQMMDSPQGKQFCSWAPVAIVVIQSTAVEMAKDPEKAKAADALGQAAIYFRLVASQCPASASVTP